MSVNMPYYGEASKAVREELHPDLVKVFDEAIKWWDNKLLDGARTIKEQEKNIATGASKTMDSKHLPRNEQGELDPNGKAWAVDAVPYPQPDWGAVERGFQAMKHADPKMEVARMYAFMGYIIGISKMMGINLRVGGDWNSNRLMHDQSFFDLDHFELELPK